MFRGNEILLVSEISIGKRKLRLVRGDITERVVDAIVSAANSNLYHGGGSYRGKGRTKNPRRE
ncbi:MAG: hypothetical protein ACM3ZS_06135 [Nitrososphaerota archaeon]